VRYLEIDLGSSCSLGANRIVTIRMAASWAVGSRHGPGEM